MLKIADKTLRSMFVNQHGPKNGAPGRDLTQHHLRGTYTAPAIAALWNQHVRTAQEITNYLQAEIVWFDPKVELPEEEGITVWIYDPQQIEFPVFPATWQKKQFRFTTSGRSFEVNEVSRWTHTHTPKAPAIK